MTRTSLRRRLGIATVGQTPRDDMVPELRRWLPDVDVVEAGALDNIDGAELAALAPRPNEADVLTTRLRDGGSLVLDHREVVPRVEAAVTRLEEKAVDATLLVCTGWFPPLAHSRPLLFAEHLLVNGVTGICGSDPRSAPLGIVCPLPEQEPMSRHKWARLGRDVPVAAASPYASTAAADVAHAARTLSAQGAGWVVLDCMGYTQAMRAAAAGAAGVPVLLARSVVARLAAEVVT